MYSTGIGKTTLANEICLKWAKDKDCFLSKDYDLIILIQLRTVQERALKQVMIEAVGSEAAYDELLTKSHGEGCLIILEGLDEISAHWQENDTMFCQLVKNVFLSYANILVTSRPHACIDLYYYIKGHARTIEIVGFDKPQIKEHAKLYFHNSNTAEKFMEQVNNDPHISSLCYVPLCLNMVLDCFKHNNETLHTTLTELYQSFIVSKVDEHIHFKKAVSLGTVLESDQKHFKDLATILSDVPYVLSKEALETMFLLSKLAYKSYFQWSDKAYRNPMMIYTNKDLAQCSITNSGNDACGLLKATNTLFGIINTAVYAFNHLSVQEYFCALYISLLPEDQQLQLLKNHITDYPHMWPFYAGITKLRSSDVLHYLCQFLLQNEKLEETVLIYCNILIDNKMKNVNASVALNSIYEAQVSSDACIHQLISLFISSHTLNPYNYTSIFYLMSIAPITCLHLRGCNIGDEEVEELLARCKDFIPSLKVLDLYRNIITHKGIESMIKSSTNLTHISAAFNPIGDDGIHLFSLKHLIQLNISNINMTEVGACVLDEFSVNNSLQSLEISYNIIEDKGLTGILNNLPSTLVRLIVAGCNLTYHGAVSIGKMLRVNETLKHLEISTNSIGDDGISAISGGLHVNTTLIQLVACSCEFHSKGAESVAIMLRANKALKYLNISKNQIGDDGITAVALSIQANTTLVQLNISSCYFCKQGAERIAEVLRINRTLTCLDISANYIEYDEISALACSIQANTTLVKLKISDTYYESHKFKFTNETLKLIKKVHCGGNEMFSNEPKNWIDITCSGGEMDFEGNY